MLPSNSLLLPKDIHFIVYAMRNNFWISFSSLQAAVPSWLLEELRKKQAKAAAEAEDGAKAGPQKVTGPRIDGRRSPTPSDSEASDDEVMPSALALR